MLISFTQRRLINSCSQSNAFPFNRCWIRKFHRISHFNQTLEFGLHQSNSMRRTTEHIIQSNIIHRFPDKEVNDVVFVLDRGLYLCAPTFVPAQSIRSIHSATRRSQTTARIRTKTARRYLWSSSTLDLTELVCQSASIAVVVVAVVVLIYSRKVPTLSASFHTECHANGSMNCVLLRSSKWENVTLRRRVIYDLFIRKSPKKKVWIRTRSRRNDFRELWTRQSFASTVGITNQTLLRHLCGISTRKQSPLFNFRLHTRWHFRTG